MSDSKKKPIESHSDQSKSPAELKLELIEYLDKKTSDIRSDLRTEFDRNVKSYKEELKRGNRRYFQIVLTILGILGLTSIGGIWGTAKWISSKTKRALEGEVKNVQEQVSRRLDEEFESVRIQGLIEQKAKKYTEGRVERHILAKVDNAITPFSREIRQVVSEANSELESLRTIIELEDAAHFGSRDAYQKLLKLAYGKSAFATMAKRRIIVLNRDLSIYRQPPSMYQGLSIKREGKNIPAGDLTTKELFDHLENPTLSDELRHTFMVYIIAKPKQEVFSQA